MSGPTYSTAHGLLAALGRVARPSALRWRHERADAHPVIPPPISRRQKWNFLVPFPEEVP
ncbi:hypothetical protein XAC2911_1390001 [Xanthomonas citri pv. citri]|nr:hypothetical protein XAC902_1700001 [Xanthomonas citri pv. citri]CEE27990.1 hypothetical protein XAC2911_1390001 [Xanthomonas citri pv. citri]